jgi:hypothetical protein
MQKKLTKISFFVMSDIFFYYSSSFMYLSASNAAIQPVQAEVIA